MKPLPDSYPWMAELKPKDTRPPRHEIVDRIKKNLVRNHYDFGHGPIKLVDFGFARRFKGVAACPACQNLAQFPDFWAFYWQPRDVEKMFRR